MKKIFIIFISVSVIFILCGCTNLDNYVPIEEYNQLVCEKEQVYNYSKDLLEDIDSKDIEIRELENNAVELDSKLELAEDELARYKGLLNNLNDLLGNVYYVYGEGGGTYVFGTGFSIEYKGSYYLLTAGHIVDGEWGIHKNLGFKGTDNKWIYPKLLTYENDYLNRNDYAIFCSDKINSGLNVDFDNDRGVYILGSDKLDLNVVRNIRIISVDGESGSPVIDIDGEAVGISVTDCYKLYTPIQLVLDNIE